MAAKSARVAAVGARAEAGASAETGAAWARALFALSWTPRNALIRLQTGPPAARLMEGVACIPGVAASAEAVLAGVVIVIVLVAIPRVATVPTALKFLGIDCMAPRAKAGSTGLQLDCGVE